MSSAPPARRFPPRPRGATRARRAGAAGHSLLLITSIPRPHQPARSSARPGPARHHPQPPPSTSGNRPSRPAARERPRERPEEVGGGAAIFSWGSAWQPAGVDLLACRSFAPMHGPRLAVPGRGGGGTAPGGKAWLHVRERWQPRRYCSGPLGLKSAPQLPAASCNGGEGGTAPPAAAERKSCNRAASGKGVLKQLLFCGVLWNVTDVGKHGLCLSDLKGRIRTGKKLGMGICWGDTKRVVENYWWLCLNDEKSGGNGRLEVLWKKRFFSCWNDKTSAFAHHCRITVNKAQRPAKCVCACALEGSNCPREKVLHTSRKQLRARRVCRVQRMGCRFRVHIADEESFPEFQQNENKWKILHKLGGNFCIE